MLWRRSLPKRKAPAWRNSAGNRRFLIAAALPDGTARRSAVSGQHCHPEKDPNLVLTGTKLGFLCVLCAEKGRLAGGVLPPGAPLSGHDHRIEDTGRAGAFRLQESSPRTMRSPRRRWWRRRDLPLRGINFSSLRYRKRHPPNGGCLFLWWRRRDSNPRPLGCEPNALPAELRPHLRPRLEPQEVL